MFLQNILKNNMVYQQETKPDQPLPEHGNIRGKAYYNQLTLNI
jgi:hypothetical protein